LADAPDALCQSALGAFSATAQINFFRRTQRASEIKTRSEQNIGGL
jgi:hypothetical protein